MGSRTQFTQFPLGVALLAACLGLAVTSYGQEAQDTKEPPPQVEAPPEPAAIPASDIPRRAENSLAMMRDIGTSTAPLQTIEQVRQQLEQADVEIELLSAGLDRAVLDQMSLRGLYASRLRWQAVGNRLADWQKLVSTRVQTVDVHMASIKAGREDWALTLEKRREMQLPDALVAQVRGVLQSSDELQATLRQRLDYLLTLGSSISDLKVRVDSALGAIAAAEAANRGRLLVRDADPLWTVFAGREPDEDTEAPDALEEAQDVIGGELYSAWYSQIASVTDYLGDNEDRLVAHVLLFLTLSVLLVLAQRRRKAWAGGGEPSPGVVDIVSQPYATAALVALVLSRQIYPEAPLALLDIVRLIMVLPIIILLRRALPGERRPALYTLLGLFVLDVARGLLQTQPLSSRLSLLILTTLALAAMIWAVRTERGPLGRGQEAWQKMAGVFSRLAVVVLSASIVANIAGIVSLAELLGEGTILSVFVGFGLYTVSLVLLGLLDLLQQSPAGQKLRALRRNPEVIRRRMTRVVNFLSVTLWLVAVLWFFKVWNPVWGSIIWLFSASLAVGAFEIRLGDIVGFVVAIWLGVQASRFIRFILDEDVYTRVRLPRGIPATINMMVNYGIVTIAFFVALAVAGFDLSRFAIIAGALSVGIGFGLQNVVNNFVSGLILAFERPIQIGDSVELGALWGRVNKIGIRSSVVRTFDGSEVIVPNADLISSQVINWTLSDVTRRLIVPVGVAYGSDPRQVMDLLVRTAGETPGVLQEPEPMALFMGFGDSSLNFELRAWCDFNDGMSTRTKLNLSISDALKEAGIEIPFPQRDLHLRSVNPDAGQAFGSGVSSRPPSGLPPREDPDDPET